MRSTARQLFRRSPAPVFYVHHVKGSHHVLRHPDRPEVRVVVPVHRKDLPPGTLRAIIRQAGLTVDEFLDLL